MSSPAAASPLTSDRILALAPDAASAKAGSALAVARKWVGLGRAVDGRSVWGECQGSGATPYQTRIDLEEPAFRCSCPSRKFPCKHALGLFLLLAAQPSAFAEGEPPAWVAEWLASRAGRIDRRAARAERAASPATPDDAAANERRTEAREQRAADRDARVTAGLNELSLWLRDLVRGGLAGAAAQPAAYWARMAARLVDAQAPGAARLVRALGECAGAGAGWPSRLLHRAARLHLLVEGWRRRDTLPSDVQADVRAAVGFTISDGDLAGEPAVRDAWLVAGQRTDEEERLHVRRSWLVGATTGRRALVLHFARGSPVFPETLIPGTVLDADLVFHPGAAPLRASIRARHGVGDERVLMAWTHAGGAAAEVARWTGALARQPWLERHPLLLRDVVPVRRDDAWLVRDTAGAELPLAHAAAGVHGWTMLATSGGHPVHVGGEWDGDALLPLSVIDPAGRFLPLGATYAAATA